MISLTYRILLLLFLVGCTEKYQDEQQTLSDIPTPIVDYSGKVTDRNGTALAGVSVYLKNHQRTAMTTAEGKFAFDAMEATNDMILLHKVGYYDTIVSYSGLDTTRPTFEMVAKSPDRVRLLFTGDLSFARRFMDRLSPDRTTQLITQDHSDAHLQVSNLYQSGQKLIAPMRELFGSVDFPTVNFESVATQSQATLDAIHPQKDFAYYSDSDALPLLKELNVSFVTLGNNHVYDYRPNGLQDTLDSLDAQGIAHSGAGVSVEEAFKPYRTTINGKPFSFCGATSIRGDKHSVLYVAHTQGEDKSGELNASDPFPTQGGAADAHNKARITTLLHGEKQAGYFTVYQFHGGVEYTFSPNTVALRLLKTGVKAGASLIIAHHPHTPQGYGLMDGVLVAYGMGNFIFDQKRLDTMLSHILVCDIQEQQVTHAVGYPIYIDDYIPKLLTGDIANRFIRHISEASRNGSRLLETPLVEDFRLFPYHYREYLALDGHYTTQHKSLEQEVVIDSSGEAIVDLRHLLPSDYSLSAIALASPLTVTLGRDLLWFGSFEDSDVDGEYYENRIWNFSTAVATSKEAYRGRASAHLQRDSSQSQSARLYFGRRIRTIGDARDQPNKELTFLGYFKGEKSRPFTIEADYFGSIGEQVFGTQELYHSEGGSFGWRAISRTITMPDDTVEAEDYQIFLSQNARALKFDIRMEDTHKGEAHLYVDELAIINWEESYDENTTISLSTPHNREFLRVRGAKGAYRLKLTFTRYAPAS